MPGIWVSCARFHQRGPGLDDPYVTPPIAMPRWPEVLARLLGTASSSIPWRASAWSWLARLSPGLARALVRRRLAGEVRGIDDISAMRG